MDLREIGLPSKGMVVYPHFEYGTKGVIGTLELTSYTFPQRLDISELSVRSQLTSTLLKAGSASATTITRMNVAPQRNIRE